jgi:hypothetical protein
MGMRSLGDVDLEIDVERVDRTSRILNSARWAESNGPYSHMYLI